MARSFMFHSLITLLQQARQANLAAAGEPPAVARTQGCWTRRRVLKTAGGAGLAAALPACNLISPSTPAPRIAVVGAGIAGLNAAYQLRNLGLEATVYEARNRTGGRMFSVSGAVGEGLVTNLGGALINTDHQDMLALADELGVDLFNRIEDSAGTPFPAVRYFFEGRMIPEAELAGELRPLATQITVDADRIDQDWDRYAPALDALSVADYLDRHTDLIPASWVRSLIEDSIRTEYGVEPADASALQLLFNLPTVEGRRVEILGASDEVYMVKGGSSRITDALTKILDGHIRTGMQLTAIRRRGQGFRLSFTGQPEVGAEYVILTLPFGVLRQVDMAVDLPPMLRRFIDELELGRNEKLFAGFRHRVWRRPDGFALEAWTDLGFPLVWEATQSQTGREDAALTFFFGGDQVTRLQPGTASAQGQDVVERFEAFVPGAREAATGRYLRTNWSRDRFTQGAYSNFKPGQLSTFRDFFYVESDDPRERRSVQAGNLVFAGEHLSDAFSGFMNGGAQTGRLAAELVAGMVRQSVRSAVSGSTRVARRAGM